MESYGLERSTAYRIKCRLPTVALRPFTSQPLSTLRTTLETAALLFHTVPFSHYPSTWNASCPPCDAKLSLTLTLENQVPFPSLWSSELVTPPSGQLFGSFTLALILSHDSSLFPFLDWALEQAASYSCLLSQCIRVWDPYNMCSIDIFQMNFLNIKRK